MTELQLDKRFLNAKLLNIILFSKKNIVITNYCEPEKFDALFSILYLYKVEKIDLSTISDENMLDSYLADDVDLYSGKELKKFHVFTNPKSGHVEQILQQDHLKYILVGNQKIADSDPIRKSDGVIFYSTKTGIFEPEIDPDKDLSWEEKVLNKIRKMDSIEDGIGAANKIIRLIFTKARDIYLSYVKNGNNGTTINKILKALGKKKPKLKEQMLSNLTRLINSYYLVNSSVSKDGIYKILPKAEPEIISETESKIEEISSEQIDNLIEEESKNLNKSSNPDDMSDEQLDEYHDSVFENGNTDTTEQDGDLTSIPNTNLFKEEFSKILKSDRKLLKSFNQVLNDSRVEFINSAGIEEITTPEQLYIELRSNIWAEKIPTEFSIKWFSVHMAKILKNKKNGNEFNKLFSNQEEKFKKMISNLPFGIPDFSELKQRLIKTLNVSMNTVTKEQEEKEIDPPIDSEKEPINQSEISEESQIQDVEYDLHDLEVEEAEPGINQATDLEANADIDLEKVKSSISILKKVVRKRIIENPQELDEALNNVLEFLIEP